MVRILGLDVGDRRIGVAISDRMGWTAQGLETIENTGRNAVHAKLKKIVDEYKPGKIVIGLPLNMDGSEGNRAEMVKRFGQAMKSIYSGEIIYWDERLTTVSAHRAMIDGGVRRKKRKQKVDQVAAILILQSYLDLYNNQKKEG